MNIQLHIERLVLDEGLLAGDRVTRVRDEVERELAGLLAQPGTIEALRRVGAVSTLSTTTVPPASRPHDRLGARIAMAVGYGLGIIPASRAGGGHG